MVRTSRSRQSWLSVTRMGNKKLSRALAVMAEESGVAEMEVP